KLQIVNEHCPFGGVAIDHPVICAVDRGMVRGMLETLYGRELITETALSLPTRGEGWVPPGEGNRSAGRRAPPPPPPPAPRAPARRVYLDHASTAPLRPEAREALVPWLDQTGDPSRMHAEGLAARYAVEQARTQVAELLGARNREVC